MMKLRTYILREWKNLEGDDVVRARAQFKGYSKEKMQTPYGQSGQTCQQVLDGYEAEHRLWKESFELLKKVLPE